MKKKPVIMAFFVLAIEFSFAQVTLQVEVFNFRNNKGIVHIELKNQEQEQVAAQSTAIQDKKCVFVFDGLEPGKYSFRFIHDENQNNEIDTNWLGIPREGFGFSNNPRMTFGPPKFPKTLFELKESMVIRVKPKYF